MECISSPRGPDRRAWGYHYVPETGQGHVNGMFGMKDTRKWKRLRNDVAEIKRGCWGSFDPLGVQSKSAGDATIFPKLVRDMSG